MAFEFLKRNRDDVRPSSARTISAADDAVSKAPTGEAASAEESAEGSRGAAKEKRPVIFITDSFSANSGGRTGSIFMRAKMFQELGHSVYIVTLNLKPDYSVIFKSLCDKYHLEGAVFLNPFSFFARNDIFALDKSVGKGSKLVPIEVDGRLVRKDLVDKAGNVFRRQHYRKFDGKVVHTELFDPFRKKPYLVVDVDDEGQQTFRWLLAEDGERDVFFSRIDYLSYWASKLEEEHAHPIFFSEEHKTDDMFLANPHVRGRLDVVCVIHSTFFSKPYSYGSKVNGYLGSLFQRLDEYAATVALTEQEQAHIANYCGKRPNIFHVPNYVALKDPGVVKRESRSIVACTRLVPLKRIDHQIKAMEKVVGRFPDAKLRIYGDGESREALEQLVQELGLQGNVIFMGYTSEPVKAMAASSVCLMTSQYEGLPMAMLESLSVGTPVISYDFLYGPRSCIVDGVNGRIVENGSIDELAEAICQLFADPELLSRMSDAAKQIDRKFTREGIVQRWRHVFDYLDERDGRMTATLPVLYDMSLSERTAGSSAVLTLRATPLNQQEECSYYLNLNGAKRIDLGDDLVVEGKVVSRFGGIDTVEFEIGDSADDVSSLYRTLDKPVIQARIGERVISYPFQTSDVER